MTLAFKFAAASLLAVALSTAAAQAAVVNLDAAPIGTYDIEDTVPGYGSEGPVTLNWDPLSDYSTSLIRWGSSNYSGRHAAYCPAGETVSCVIDMTVAPMHYLTLSSFFLGAWPNSDRVVSWSVVDLATSATVAGAMNQLVNGATGLTVFVGATSTAGFRILFGPDGFNSGINDIDYSYDLIPPPPAPVPLPAAGWVMMAGLGGLAALRRRRRG